MTRAELDRFVEAGGIAEKADKTLKAKLFCNAIEAGSHIIGEQCRKNSNELLDRIMSVS